MDDIILESGYNTDYIYSLIISLFYNPSNNIYNIINNDTKNSSTYYIQEYIRYHFGSIINKNISLESHIVCKLRLFLYNCGWLKQHSIDIIAKQNIADFYKFLICDIFEYSLNIIKINKNTNKSDNIIFNIIKVSKENDNKTKENIVSLSSMIDNWVSKNIGIDNYKFENIPFFIPVYIDMIDPYTKLNTKYINIMEGLSFKNICDNLQSTIIWEINSLVCQTKSGHYYSIINFNNKWIGFSDNRVPSNWKIDMSDIPTVKKIMQEVRMVFYKL